MQKIGYWILAARPKTLMAGVVPVMVASALAAHFGQFRPVAALLCLMFSLLAQIASNFGNDYYDFVKKTDTAERVGPQRAVASGWISPRAMRNAVFLTVALACCFGLGLIPFGGWWLVLVGAVCVAALLAYSAGPYPLSRHGLGDLFVLIFFGFVAVVFSVYVQTKTFPWQAFVCGAAVGFLATNILVVNNYRDYETDKKAGKRTTIVIFGRAFGRWIYLADGLAACALTTLFLLDGCVPAATLPLLWLFPHFRLWRTFCRSTDGAEQNVILVKTSRNLFLFGIFLSAGLLF